MNFWVVLPKKNGFVYSQKRLLIQNDKNEVIDFSSICVKENGFSCYINTLADDQKNKLKTCFPDNWEQI